jgi:hypothetical protein
LVISSTDLGWCQRSAIGHGFASHDEFVENRLAWSSINYCAMAINRAAGNEFPQTGRKACTDYRCGRIDNL